MEIKKSQIYPNSLILDEIENSQNIYCENDIYREISYNFSETSQNNLPNKQNTYQQQQQNNIYSSNEFLPGERKKEKGKVLHLLKNFTQEMKVRWNMSDVEIRIHNFLDENQVYITDPMQKQFDYYQKTKSQIISSILISNHSSDDEECSKGTSKNRKDSDYEALGQVLDQFNSTKYAQYNNQHNEVLQEENEEERGQNTSGSKNKGLGFSGTLLQLETATTMSSINSQLSLQSSSILAKRKQRNSIILQTPQSFTPQDNNYEQYYYN